MKKIKSDLVVVHAKQLLTLQCRAKGARSGSNMRELGIIEDGAIYVKDGNIAAVGPTDEVASKIDLSRVRVLDCSGKVAMPGFVDSHTHLLFSGHREEEYFRRLQGASYEEIQKSGGGILRTVRETRRASREELLNNSIKILDSMLTHGTTTVEIKSGYGLNTENELRLLSLCREMNEKHGIEVVPTFCGAHAIPEEYQAKADEYVSLIVNEMLPAVGRQGIAEFCDVYCERGNFSPHEAKRILQAGKTYGLTPKIHADAFEYRGASDVAVEVDAVSADHLTKTPPNLIERLASAGVIGVLMPAFDFTLGSETYANARGMIERGLPLALATDLSPACMTESMQLVIALACLKLRMTPEEAITAATVNSAYALGRGEKVGTIEVGKQADIIILDIPNYRFIPYHFGVNLVEQVVKRGIPLFKRAS